MIDGSHEGQPGDDLEVKKNFTEEELAKMKPSVREALQRALESQKNKAEAGDSGWTQHVSWVRVINRSPEEEDGSESPENA